MNRPEHIDAGSQRISDRLPSGLREGGADLRRHLRAAAVAARLGPLDLVSRHEFEVQRALLLRARAQLTALAQRIALLEAGMARRAAGD